MDYDIIPDIIQIMPGGLDERRSCAFRGRIGRLTQTWCLDCVCFFATTIGISLQLLNIWVTFHHLWVILRNHGGIRRVVSSKNRWGIPRESQNWSNFGPYHQDSPGWFKLQYMRWRWLDCGLSVDLIHTHIYR